jgi:glycosyltransferase involved in cell wall biosynthesis
MLDSVLRQRLQPASIHIVDDGSSDTTPDIITAYAAKSRLIRATTLQRKGSRKEGGESAIQVAFASVDWDHIDVLARMDADLSFDQDFFLSMVTKFENSSKLGIASGVIYEQKHGQWTAQRGPVYHTRGASKLYRRECYHQIQPIGTRLGWDGQDEARANSYGWETRSYEDAVIYHHRPVGAGVSRVRYFRNLGLSAYYIGYHPLFLLLRAFIVIHQKPFLLGTVMMLVGMVEGYAKKLPREDRREVISFVREQQLKRLLGRKTMWK